MATAKSKAAAAEATESIATKRNRLRAKAEKIILDRYRDEFNAEADRVFAEEGLTFNRRLTPQEQARKKLNKLLEDNPELRDVLAGQLAAASGESGPVPDDFGTVPADLEQHSGDLELTGDLTKE